MGTLFWLVFDILTDPKDLNEGEDAMLKAAAFEARNIAESMHAMEQVQIDAAVLEMIENSRQIEASLAN